MADEEKVKRQPVTYLWSKLNWNFLKMLAEIAHYAEGKYGSAEQYMNARLTGQASPINHIYEHLRAFQAGEVHDRFGTVEHQLAAVAYNAMMEYAYIKLFGFVGNPVMPPDGPQVADRLKMNPATPADSFSAAEKVRAETAAIVEEQNALVTDWPEGLSHFRLRWQDGLDNAREPLAIAKWTAMLWVIDQFTEVKLTDDIVLPMFDELKAAVKEKLMALATPENIAECTAKLGAIDVLRIQIPQQFKTKAVSS